MASEDVLDGARDHERVHDPYGYEFCLHCNADWPCLVSRLAAEVRELRKDKARLDWVLANCTFRRRSDPLLPDWAEGDRLWIDKQVDAAMGEPQDD